MAYKHVLSEKKNNIVYVTINRPDSLNAVYSEVNKELSEIWRNFRDDPVARVAILTGAGGKSFCVGADLKVMAAHGPASREQRGIMGGLVRDFECWKPIIAAVNGLCLGGGFEIAMACDLIIAAEHARFGLPEVLVGLVAGEGGMHRLPRQVPLKTAMGILLTGRQFSAQEALQMGIVNEVVPMADLIPAAEKWAAQIIRCAPLAIQATKEAVIKGLGMPLETALSATFNEHLRVKASEDAREGARAFAQKRPPQWKGA